MFLAKETHIMDATTRTAFVIAFVVAALLLFFFGHGMAIGAVMNGRVMGSASMGGIGSAWLPILLVTVGVGLFSVISRKK